MLKVIVIDDEADIRNTLCDVLQSSGHWQIVGQADSVVDALLEVINKKPDVIFCDIKLREGTAFDLLAKLRSTMRQMPCIILNTGFSDFELAQTALNDYGDCVVKILKKPFYEGWSITEAEIIAEIKNRSQSNLIPKKSKINDKFIFVKTNGKYSTKIDVKSIKYFKSESGGAHIYTEGAVPYFSYMSLSDITIELMDSGFIRIHKSYIINLAKVAAKSDTEIKLESGEVLPIGRSYRHEVASSFRNI